MSFISDNIGYFVVGLFLVLAARDGYSLCRPASATESVLSSRRFAAAAMAAVPILVLFFLRGWNGAAAGAVLLVVLIGGYFYLYRRSLPYVPYPGRRPGQGGNPRPTTGDKVMTWLNRDRTHFRDMLASGMVPTAAQLGTCNRVDNNIPTWHPDRVMGYVERRTFEEVTGIIARSYTRPRWYHRPWRHRLHYTLKQRVERYDTEFAAERGAFERLELLSKEAEAADLVRQRNAAEASNRRFPRSDASRLAILERDIDDLRQDAADEEFMKSGMVFRVLTCVEINQ